jgi:hypothetical protein
MPELHDVRAYWRGCTCETCKAAWYTYRRMLTQHYADHPPAHIPHGTESGHDHYRCRCTPCKRAKRGAVAKREAQLVKDPSKCGTRTQYQKQKCRCFPCTEANNAYMREYKARRKR